MIISTNVGPVDRMGSREVYDETISSLYPRTRDDFKRMCGGVYGAFPRMHVGSLSVADNFGHT